MIRLKKGILLDAQPGFVDAFNEIADFVENLRGDAEIDTRGRIKIDRTVKDHPVVRFNGSSGGMITVSDGNQQVETDKGILFDTEENSRVIFNIAKDESSGMAVVKIGVRYT